MPCFSGVEVCQPVVGQGYAGSFGVCVGLGLGVIVETGGVVGSVGVTVGLGLGSIAEMGEGIAVPPHPTARDRITKATKALISFFIVLPHSSYNLSTRNYHGSQQKTTQYYAD
jgi:hypothetical protein